MADYSVLVQAVLQRADIQKQLNDLQKNIKPITLSVKANATDVEKLNITIGKMQNQLEGLGIRNKDAFKNPEVQAMAGNVKNLITNLDGSANATGRAQVAMGQLRNKVADVNGQIRLTSAATDGFGTALGKAVGKIAMWAVATTAIYGSLRQLEQGVQYVKDLNKEMTDIALVMNKPIAEMGGMAGEFNVMAKELGVSTLTVAQGAKEWIRQGKTAAETTDLLRNSTMLAKLGDMEAADATTKLTAVVNSYRISVEDSIGVVDTLVRLDQEFATSTKEIAEAMSESSSMARQAGIDYQNLASYITVISSITRQSGDTIGNAMKSIAARMMSVKAGVDFDDQGESINNVEKVLKKFDIQLRDSALSFRDLDDVLADAAKKYNELGEAGDTVAQGQITTAIAGLRQANYLAALFQNWDQVTKAQNVAADSAGATAERYNIYLESIEASSNKLKTTWQEMWSKSISGDTIKGFIDFGTSILELINKLGGLPPVLNTILGLLVAINATNIVGNIQTAISKLPSLIALYNSLAGALTGVSVAAGAATGALALIGIGFAAYGLGTAAINYSEQERSMDKLVTQFEESRQSAKDSKKELESLADEYETLASKEDKTLEDRERLLEIQGIINGTYSETSAGLDLYTNAVDLNTDAIKRNVDAIREQARAQAELFLQESKGQYDTAKSFLSTKTRGIAKGKWTEFTPEERAKQLQSDINDLQKEGTQNSKTLAKAKQHELNLLKVQIANAKKIVAEYETQVDVLGLVEDKLKDVAKSSKKAFNWQGSGLKESARMTSEEFEKASQAYWEFADAQKTLSDSLQEFNETGSVSDETAQKLVDAGYGAAVSWDSANGAFTINKDLLGQINIEMAQVAANAAAAAAAEAQKALQDAQLANATEATLEPLRQQAIALQNVADAAQGRLDLLKTTGGLPTVTGGGGGGGGSSAKSAAQKQEEQNIKNSINGLEDKKKRLQDSLKEFKKYIDAQKDSLKLLKEEKEFNDELMKKNKQLAKLKTQIALLDMDNSEEAQARKLELQEEAADIEEEIEQQKQDRIYEIQVEALDKAYEKFADSIDKQIEKIDELIEAWNNMLEALTNLATPGGGGGGGGGGTGIFSSESKAARDKLLASGAVNISPYAPTHGGGYIAESQVETFHSGGIVGLKPDERMIKAQVGETVLTQSQSNAIASLLSHAPNVSTTSGNYGSPQITMEFNVAGNLDKSVLPDLKSMTKQMIKEVNRTMLMRGNIRTVNLTAS